MFDLKIKGYRFIYSLLMYDGHFMFEFVQAIGEIKGMNLNLKWKEKDVFSICKEWWKRLMAMLF